MELLVWNNKKNIHKNVMNANESFLGERFEQICIHTQIQLNINFDLAAKQLLVIYTNHFILNPKVFCKFEVTV